MASGLIALLDDVAGIAKIAASSLDDVAAAAGKAGTKAAGVVVDDAAVTPGYAMGFTPDRELPIVWKIALGSLKNKFLFLLPGALLLSAFAPFLITPLLMIGGAYLCFEAAEKILESLGGHHASEHPEELALSSEELEKQKVGGAIRTDLILSAEIMAIALNELQDLAFPLRAAALALVGFAITVAVYGVVAIIVKTDDVGLHLAARKDPGSRSLGTFLVRAMPVILRVLAVVGTAAMLWVGGGIIVHGLHEYHWDLIPNLVEAPAHALEGIAGVGPVLAWVATALGSALVGFVIGGVIAGALHLLPKRKKAAH